MSFRLFVVGLVPVMIGCTVVGREQPAAHHVQKVPVTETAPIVVGPSAKIASPANGAGDADVIDVVAEHGVDGLWDFHVTVRHQDTGRSHFLDGWDVVLPDGTVVLNDPTDRFTRRMFHPHVRTPEFRRSKQDVSLPEEVTSVTVRAHDSKFGYGGEEVRVDLQADAGDRFVVIRHSGEASETTVVD
jgi:hypothetical protein